MRAPIDIASNKLRTAMSSLKLTAAGLKSLILLLVVAFANKGVRGHRDFECQTLALQLYAFAKPSSNLDCKKSCDERYADLREMPKNPVRGFHFLAASQSKLIAYANTEGIFWIDECVAWLRYCFRQRAAMLTIDKNVLDFQQSTSAGPALTCLCRSVFLLMQVRKDPPNGPKFCEQQMLCQRLTSRLNLKDYGFWSCQEGKHIMKAPCSTAVPICPCCQKGKNQFQPVPCPNWPELDEFMNERFVLGDQEWLPYDLHDSPQPEEGFPLGTVLVPQGLACPAEQEGLSRFRAASLPFRAFDKSACGQADSGAMESSTSGASRMHSHFESMSEARERTHQLQLQDCLRPPQKQGEKRKAAAIADASGSISALASIRQSLNSLAPHGSQFSEAYPFSFTITNYGELYFGTQFVSVRNTAGEGHSIGNGASGSDPDNLQVSQVFAGSDDLAAEHVTTALDPDNLRFSDFFAAAESAATTNSIPPAGLSNSDDSVKKKQDSLNAFEGIP